MLEKEGELNPEIKGPIDVSSQNFKKLSEDGFRLNGQRQKEYMLMMKEGKMDDFGQVANSIMFDEDINGLTVETEGKAQPYEKLALFHNNSD